MPIAAPSSRQADVDAARLHEARADLADVGDLGTQVVVEQLQAVEHAASAPELVDHLDDLGRVEAEHAAVAAGLASSGRSPLAESLMRTPSTGLTPISLERRRIRGNSSRVSMTHDAVEPDHPGVQGQVDEGLVLVPVADQERVRVVQVGHGGDQLGLAAGLQAVVVPLAEAGDLLDDLLLLVHLDGEDAAERHPGTRTSVMAVAKLSFSSRTRDARMSSNRSSTGRS